MVVLTYVLVAAAFVLFGLACFAFIDTPGGDE